MSCLAYHVFSTPCFYGADFLSKPCFSIPGSQHVLWSPGQAGLSILCWPSCQSVRIWCLMPRAFASTFWLWRDASQRRAYQRRRVVCDRHPFNSKACFQAREIVTMGKYAKLGCLRKHIVLLDFSPNYLSLNHQKLTYWPHHAPKILWWNDKMLELACLPIDSKEDAP